MFHVALRPYLLAIVVLTLLGIVSPQSAFAGPAIVTTRTPYAFAFTTCSGEVVTFEGFIHSTVRFETTSDSTKLTLQANLQNVKGIGSSGARYVLIHTGAVSSNSSGAFPREETQILSFRLIRQGEDKTLESGDDTHSRVVIHFTVNANGTVTVDKSEIAAVCR